MISPENKGLFLLWRKNEPPPEIKSPLTFEEEAVFGYGRQNIVGFGLKYHGACCDKKDRDYLSNKGKTDNILQL